MDLMELRATLKTTPITMLPLRVTFYARVSSETDAQLNSLGNQVGYFIEYIKSIPTWTYVEGYVDEGISGMMVTKRKGFQRMMHEAKEGKFDLIVTKEVSRFARNTLDSIQYTRQLLKDGVGVLFKSEGFNTLAEDGELYLTMMAMMAQQEMLKLSNRVKFGHERSILKGVVLGNSRMFGYDKKDGKLVVNEDQAVMVRRLFELYSTGAYSMRDLETLLFKEGFRNHNGGAVNHSTMSKIIRNPKYKGYYVGNKVKIVDMFTKQQKFLPEDEWHMFKDETGEIVPAIVDEGVWEQANAILDRRSNDVKKRQNLCTHGNLLTGKLFCTHCGALYHRKESVDRKGKRNSRWACSVKLTKGAKTCPSFYIFESEIKPILYNAIMKASASIDEILNFYTRAFAEEMQSGTIETEIAEAEKVKGSIEQRKMKLLDLCAAGKISDDDFERMNGQLTDEHSQAEMLLIELNQKRRSMGKLDEKLKRIRAAMSGASQALGKGEITQTFVDEFVERIDVTPLEDGSMNLEIKLFMGVPAQSAVISRGHTFKKMITDYQNQASGK